MKNQTKLKQLKQLLFTKSLLFVLILLSAGTMSCNKSEDEGVEPIDYTNAENWVTMPQPAEAVDVFYVYPTVSANPSGTMNIKDDDERALAVGIYKAQASVFEGTTNIFAPYYRQMSTKVQAPEGSLATDTKEFKQGAADVQQAFEYYIQHLNNGRPFIIAGHSQGTMALIELIKNSFGSAPELRNRLVAAYLIGYTVTDADLAAANLTAAQNAFDVGVVITYNTQSVTSAGGPMLLPGAHCINPLNWRTDGEEASASDNLGAVFFDDATGTFLREEPHYCGAQINTEKAALTTTIPEGEQLDIGPYEEGVYHRFDYAFWYRNLEQNVKDRIEAYMEKPDK